MTGTQKSELTGNGFKVSVTFIGGKVEVVINDLTMHGSDGITMFGSNGITVVGMCHDDKMMLIGTDHTIIDTMQGYRSKEL